ncbi:SDR family oxidoreductase [Vulcaniibacterium thermophilum]|uniref:Short-chain dehydrogenase n=1 Tax=Vulcaniibacterium thermophilum TaxID=1169913 RepID=A0A918Z878_9GAMM|nr:SDR family oxidoreductase [Vulcaniibacterium thermophilum]GHE39960.1 short-chain dehydrogenase [Vulcaniibacterium thermophilum]
MKHALKPLDQQVVVVTGASSGIGLCTALLAAERGAKVALVARSGDVLDIIVEEIRESGGDAIALPADVADRGQLEAVAADAALQYGRIDTWINNAGVSIYGRLDQVRDEDSRRLFDTNFWGVVYGSLVALPYLRRQGGALINVGSEVSDAVVPLQGMYSASKHAVKGFTDALRMEVEVIDRAPVSITLIQPTAVNTPYPQRARNYLAHEPKLPSPQIDPHRVAEAILAAATEGGRDVRVGAMAVMNTAMSKLMPRVMDRLAPRYVREQQEDAPPHDPEGSLFRPVPHNAGRVYGHPPY